MTPAPTPTAAGFHWQRCLVTAKLRPVEVRWFDYTGSAPDSTALNPKDAPPAFLWAPPGSASWWNLPNPEALGWEWAGPVAPPDGDGA